MLFKNSVRTSKRTPYFTITKINWLTLFKFNTDDLELLNYVQLPLQRLITPKAKARKWVISWANVSQSQLESCRRYPRQSCSHKLPAAAVAFIIIIISYSLTKQSYFSEADGRLASQITHILWARRFSAVFTKACPEPPEATPHDDTQCQCLWSTFSSLLELWSSSMPSSGREIV
jgi:hypothetical protein